MEECKYVTPSLNDTGDGHLVACHLYLNDEDKAALQSKVEQIKQEELMQAEAAKAKSEKK